VIFGILISTYIINQENGYKSKNIDKLCSKISESGCDAALNYKLPFLISFKFSDLSTIFLLLTYFIYSLGDLIIFF